MSQSNSDVEMAAAHGAESDNEIEILKVSSQIQAALQNNSSIPLPLFKKESFTDLQVKLPGDYICDQCGILSGHGTYEQQGRIYSSLCGFVKRMDQLVYIQPLKSSYIPEVGDLIVGRVQEIDDGKWHINLGGSATGTLALSCINLPGSVQRRRVDEDYLEMRNYFKPGDLLSCEVQRVQHNSGPLLHTRSARYGRLENGCFLQVPPYLITKQRSHINTLGCGLLLILGRNGYVWISEPYETMSQDTLNFSLVEVNYHAVPYLVRYKIALVRNCILALVSQKLSLSTHSIEKVYRAAEKMFVTPQKLLLEGLSCLNLSV